MAIRLKIFYMDIGALKVIVATVVIEIDKRGLSVEKS